MNKIFSIYLQDLRGIITNWVAAVMIIGLIVLPSLYAWFNIKASWDPYGQTSGISIAVTNLDQGTTLRGKDLKIGDEIANSLKENHNIGWTFTGKDEALTGLNHGDYYAVIIIPSDFSARIATVLSTNPVKAKIEYFVNEKINAIAPKITSKGANSIIEEVNQNFIKTANGTIFQIFNKIGVELEQELPLIRKTKSIVMQIEALFPEINRAADTAIKDLQTSREVVSKVQNEIPRATDLATKGQEFAASTVQFLEHSQQVIDSSGPVAKEMIVQLQQTAKAVVQTADLIQSALNQVNQENPQENILPKMNTQLLATAAKAADSLSEMLERLGGLNPSGSLSKSASELAQVSSEFKQLNKFAEEINLTLTEGKLSAGETLDKFGTLAHSLTNRLDQLTGKLDEQIIPQMKLALEQAKTAVDHTNSLLGEALSDLPKVNDVLNDASRGLSAVVKEAEIVRSDLPEAEKKISKLTDQISKLEKEGTLEDLISLLSLNYAKESEFFAEPVTLKENRLFPIPNYGSAMSPFFTTLSLWVGGLLLVSMLTVEVHDKNAEYRSYQVYFGRFLTFATLALLQSLFVTIGDVYLLGTYAVEPIKFIVFGLLISAVFMLMIYTLVSVFGNVGKALAIVLMVLQLAGSGGTFPIQVTPPFFQAIHPFLPFTYGISLLREAVGGSVGDIVIRDICIMFIYAGLALIVGLGLKQVVNRYSAKWVRKAKSGHLIH
ncbi:YhgE/Pip domain-containing protein [Paenibacillus anaericanus]|uniref:YhgE/Pip domain-containing protein n=1 Tax=Paenibacillus anaericanus TaxID=170367 RepID=A0A3S1DUC5_9BACL|nr:YhgE/Pip domain-containing protein [Paenibacillus anaericanus]RUT47563.1 YhgE/Pip domain-containing protein [Paenibacillus anaericanus]